VEGRGRREEGGARREEGRVEYLFYCFRLKKCPPLAPVGILDLLAGLTTRIFRSFSPVTISTFDVHIRQIHARFGFVRANHLKKNEKIVGATVNRK
jgi:hypothetical protein